MAFSSPTFLLCFLPLMLLLAIALPASFTNGWLLLSSLLFYLWSGPANLLVLVASIAFNWRMGQLLQRRRNEGRTARGVLAAGVAANLALLATFKFSDLLWAGILHFYNVPRHVGPVVAWTGLPPGVSFFTFHAISYLVDIHRGDAAAFTSPVGIGLYFSFFPQLIAGPIVRYREIAAQIRQRALRSPGLAAGIERFVIGLSRKVLVADPVGEAASHVFALPAADLSCGTAWFGLACFTVQIYFDFAGYSDMAIGLGRMFGFRLPENFDFPYAARSLREFWRRWHMSLSSWFRDYLYIPLGGNRGSQAAVAGRLLLVFVLCGLWHGVGGTFLAWGLYHGLFLSLERGPWGRLLARVPGPLAHAYALGVAALGWVFFRSASLGHAGVFYATLFGLRSGSAYGGAIVLFQTAKTLVPLAAGILASLPLPWASLGGCLPGVAPPGGSVAALSARFGVLAILFVLSVAFVASETFHPFLYFRF